MVKRVLLDGDGVAFDLIGHVLKLLKEKGFKNLPTYEQVDDAHYDIFKPGVLLEEDALHAAIELLNSRGFVQGLPLIDKAVEGVQKIKAAGHEVFWLSSPWFASETWDFDRRAAIYKHFGDGYRAVSMTNPKYIVSGDALIDDTTSNCDKWAAEQGGLAMLYNQPWNQKSKLPRFTWDQIDSFLEKIG